MLTWDVCQQIVVKKSILPAAFFSTFAGIGFGYYPARKAAYLDPKGGGAD
jgi:ABC-type antimicrobial peptide transport system permease subunit